MRIAVDTDLRIPMRDGVELAADLYLPDTGRTVPTLVERTPYEKGRAQARNFALEVRRAAEAGFAVLVQDTRGRFASGGTFRPFRDEASDGADTVQWVARQAWCSGWVAMIGGSYAGFTQWAAAAERPAALAAITPFMTAADVHRDWVYRGGAFNLGFMLTWTLGNLVPGEAVRRARRGQPRPAPGEIASALDAIDGSFRFAPSFDLSIPGDLAAYYREWLEHPVRDEYWRALGGLPPVDLPAFTIAGWHDVFLAGALAEFASAQAKAATGQADPSAELARGAELGWGESAAEGAAGLPVLHREHAGLVRLPVRSRLIVGPWAHRVTEGTFPDRGYGRAAGAESIDLTGLQLRWLSSLVADTNTVVDPGPPVQLFVMGANEWRGFSAWPPPDASRCALFLTSESRANTAAGNGGLSWHEPRDNGEDTYVYDPFDPAPTIGGQTFLPGLEVAANSGPRDTRPAEARQDVLCYTTEPLDRGVDVIGPVELVLFVASSAEDTDFTGRLVDVSPDGRAEHLTEGILRARYRDGATEPRLLRPGQRYELHLELGATANRFAAGHRIRLEVSSSNFPRFDRNTNTGGEIAREPADRWRPALNRVLHGPSQPSRLILYVLDLEPEGAGL
jgi:putative CocE/NonD family hydrolase